MAFIIGVYILMAVAVLVGADSSGCVGLAFFAFIACAFLAGIHIFIHRRPLDQDETVDLAIARRHDQAMRRHRFSQVPQQAHPAEKKAMRGHGEFVACDLAFHDLPARVAGLLKYKKHEWLVVAFVRFHVASTLWWNKGPDATRVFLELDQDHLRRMALENDCDTLVLLHNHPNPDPSRWATNQPSSQDLVSAACLSELLAEDGLSVLEFICERGVPHMYFASFGDLVEPLRPILRDIEAVNGRSVLRNYSLRRELRRRRKRQFA